LRIALDPAADLQFPAVAATSTIGFHRWKTCWVTLARWVRQEIMTTDHTVIRFG